jgi:NADH-quinone oxidoreductase subunit G
MEIFTNTPMVKKAREGVLEFLLINHPLDCPICDQGGECDLQDETLGYGRDDSRYAENKRAVEEKFMGPLVKTVMTRCIQCTRCVRFVTEVAGAPEIGMTGRGEDAEITTYLESALSSELSGNIVDLCPVGALTSKPYAFSARPWELRKTETVDVMDALGSNIRADARGAEVMRVLPRLNEAVNEEWISDKTRHACDGLMRQRLDRPYVREGKKLKPAAWGEAFEAIAKAVKKAAPERIGVIAGDLQDAESMKAALDLFGALGSANLDCRQDGAKLDPKAGRESYLFNTTIAGIEDADVLVLVGTNPRLEAPVLNARIRKRWLTGKLRVAVIGEQAALTYDYDYLGAGAASLAELASGRGDFAKALKGASNPMIVVGQGALARDDGAAVLNLAAKAAAKFGMVRPKAKGEEGWNGFNVLHTAAARVGGLDLGFVPGEGGLDAEAMVQKGALDVLFLLGADEVDVSQTDALVVYLGTHGDRGAHRADVILPGAAYTEKPGIYVNTEGRAQLANRSVFPKGEAREDWAILRALSEHLGKKLPYDSLDALRAKLFAEHPSFGQIDYAPGASTAKGFDLAKVGAAGKTSEAPFASPIVDYYQTNPVARASVTMAECSAVAATRGRLMAAE